MDGSSTLKKLQLNFAQTLFSHKKPRFLHYEEPWLPLDVGRVHGDGGVDSSDIWRGDGGGGTDGEEIESMLIVAFEFASIASFNGN